MMNTKHAKKMCHNFECRKVIPINALICSHCGKISGKAEDVAKEIERKLDNDENLSEHETELSESYWFNFNVRLGKKAAEDHKKGFADFVQRRKDHDEELNELLLNKEK